MLLAGVVVFCHAALRTSQWMEEATSSPVPDEESEEQANHWLARIESIGRERWWALVVLAPVGAGALAGSLSMLAISRRWRFSVRTLSFVTIYWALLIGIPCGLVRPRLQSPRIWLRAENPDLAFGQRRLRLESGTRQGNAWAAGSTGSIETFPLANRYNVLVAAAAFILTPAIALLPVPCRPPQRSARVS